MLSDFIQPLNNSSLFSELVAILQSAYRKAIKLPSDLMSIDLSVSFSNTIKLAKSPVSSLLPAEEVSLREIDSRIPHNPDLAKILPGYFF